MNKNDFLKELKNGLRGLPADDIEECLSFYSEMIDDRIENGMSEEEAVLSVGSTNEIVTQTMADIPLGKLVKEKAKPSRALRAWEIVLLILGSPIWFSLLVAAFSVILSLYIVLWTLIISLWAIEISFIACGFAGVAVGILYMSLGKALTGIALLCAGLLLLGLSIFLFFGCRAATNGILMLSKKFGLGIKKLFVKKEAI